ncbi:hypothetical protein LOTGIDRAFT_232842 [Lottia gigantea]|uniref:Uncharacterized protein n=1 Tax=Lottia gigantea TaxID=225164 RepID=V4AI61_LOTGI|nr:hypothetical protein LOTGIDRAFT_232842 [Lottia gigantea]ESO93111.1 hypothetical protein LOTGIDRAFT_232842 [Lottia gigantea]
MSKPFNSGLAPETSERIYKQLLNVGTPTVKKTSVRGKINKRPAFSSGKLKGPEQDSDLLPLEFYNFHYNTSPRNGTLRDENVHDLRKHNTSPCPSTEENVEEDSMVKMLKIRATSAYVRNPECYQRNPEFFMSCTPTERRNMSNQKPVVWNHSHQALRLDKEWAAKAQCRATKRHSELVKHRTDKMYILNGAALGLKNRYSIPDGETQHLKELSLARHELRNELREAREIHNRSRNISALRSRSRTESVKLPRLSAKSKDLVTDSNSMVPSIYSNTQSNDFGRKQSKTGCITVEGTQHPVDKQNDEMKAETAEKQRVVAADGDEEEHTAVDKASDMKLASEEDNPNQPVPEESSSSDSEHDDPEENDVAVNQAFNECTTSDVDLANNIDIEMTNNTGIDTTVLQNTDDPTNNQYDEETEAALQFYGEVEDEDEHADDDADRLSI